MPQLPRRLSWRQLITVEPVIFLYAYGLFMHLPIIQQYVYYRVSEDKGFPYKLTKDKGCSQDEMNATMKELEQEVRFNVQPFFQGDTRESIGVHRSCVHV